MKRQNVLLLRISVVIVLSWVAGQVAASIIEADEHNVSFFDAMFIESWKQ